LGLLDKKILLILAYTAFQLPLALYVLRNFFGMIPVEIQESAELDGCSPLGVLIRIILPLSGPGLLAAFILTFVFNWNEFLFALVATSFDARTAPVVLTVFLESESSLHWSELSTLGFCMTFPVLIFTIFLNEYLIKVLLAGSVKG
jgi:multiple sugar transport system permease protein